jgi:endothelin-converting enzyme/putative endopeptidase
MRPSSLLLLSIFIICGHALAQNANTTAATDSATVQHVDVKNVDTSANPCDNFFHYACDKVIAAEPIPPDQARWGSFDKLTLWNQQELRSILETYQAANPSRTPNEQKIGDFYASCVGQADSGRDDHSVLTPLMDRIRAMQSLREFPSTLAAVQMAFGSMWEGNDNQTNTALFGYGPTPDANDVSRVVAGVDQGGLGLPSRDYYLKDDPHTKEIREAYKQLIIKVFIKEGLDANAAQAHADTVLRVETALAHAQMDNITRRDPNKTNNRYTLAQLKTLVPKFDWDTYFTALGAPAVPLYEVSSPGFMRTVSTLLAAEPIETWKVYLSWQLLYHATPALGDSWRKDAFEFTRLLSGAKQQLPTWRRCSQSTDAYLGEALGQVYVAKNFPADSKQRVLKMVKDIEAAMGRDLDQATWMQTATRKEAHLKLAAIVEKIGYPDKWINYSSLTISRQGYPENVERATAFEFKRQLSFINKPLDRTQWFMTPATVNAYEDPQTNTINFPAGILHPPFFDPAADDVINYGSTGAVLGHELTHDFDDEGRKFDLKGNLRDWWTAQDAKAYEDRGSCISREYTGPVPGVEGVTQNGKLTQGEDTADNGGIYLALSALTSDLMQQGKTMQDKDSSGLTNLQRFFLAFANDWCSSARPEIVRTQVATNPHSIPELRLNNTVGNMPEFAKAFGCKAGQPMVHAPMCRVW